jgi:hypothetical protein
MARTDDDSWDLATSVGATATLVAAARALASRQGDPLVDDPFAEALVRAVGIPAFTQALDGSAGGLADAPASRVLIDVVAVRTRFFDDFFTGAAAAFGALPMILASGPGAGSRKTIGVVIFSGAIFATLLTLFVVPVIYNLLARYTKSPDWTARQIESLEKDIA